MRLFIGIEMSRKAKLILKKFQEEFSHSVRGSYTKDFHCTLLFLGEVNVEDSYWIEKKLEKINIEKFSCAFSILDSFGPEEFPTLLLAGLESVGLHVLQQVIATSLQERYKSDFSEYVPHVTLARIRAITNKIEYEKKMRLDLPNFHFDVREFILYKTIPSDEGSKFEKVAIFPLEQPKKELDTEYKLPKL